MEMGGCKYQFNKFGASYGVSKTPKNNNILYPLNDNEISSSLIAANGSKIGGGGGGDGGPNISHNVSQTASNDAPINGTPIAAINSNTSSTTTSTSTSNNSINLNKNKTSKLSNFDVNIFGTNGGGGGGGGEPENAAKLSPENASNAPQNKLIHHDGNGGMQISIK